jgi:hypothetical protein
MDLAPYLTWLGGRLSAGQAVLHDALQLVTAIAVLLLVMCFVAWRREARRALILERASADRDADLVVTRTALENEIKWRLAGEASGEQISHVPTNVDVRPLRGIYDIPPKEILRRGQSRLGGPADSTPPAAIQPRPPTAAGQKL